MGMTTTSQQQGGEAPLANITEAYVLYVEAPSTKHNEVQLPYNDFSKFSEVLVVAHRAEWRSMAPTGLYSKLLYI